MRISLGTRLAFLIVGTIAVALAIQFLIINYSTRKTFVDSEIEVRTHLEANMEERQAYADEVEAAFQSDSWSGVREFVAQSESNQLGEFAAIVLNVQFGVQAVSEPALESARIRRNEEGLEVNVQTRSDFDSFQLVFKADHPEAAPNRESQGLLTLRDNDDSVFGHVLFVPFTNPERAGSRFAFRVWQSAGIWLGLTIGLLMLATAFLLKRSLHPVELLTHAARELQQGNIPEQLQDSQDPDFGELINAFNSATQSIAQTDKIRKQLISDIAHELRTPLTNIKGQLEAVDSGLIAPDNNLLQTLRSESQLLERLVNDFQELAVSDAGQLQMNLQPLPLLELIEGILPGLAASASVVDSELNIPPSIAVLADEDRVKQILGNLMENSVRHNANDLKITITAELDSDFACLCFSDSGRGIAPEHQPFIFDRFFRAEKSRNRDSGGSGLGLAIVKAIVEAMNGTIRYLDEPTGGARFEIRLPAVF